MPFANLLQGLLGACPTRHHFVPGPDIIVAIAYHFFHHLEQPMVRHPLHELARQHITVSRRFFLQLSAVGAAAFNGLPIWAQASEVDAILAEAIAELEYLTKSNEFQIVSRGTPRPDKLSPEKRLEVGLDPKTWQLEVIADPDSDAQVKNPMTKQGGNALDWSGLMRLAEDKAVRFMKVITCTNMGQPLGMGLWEGVPLRDVLWMAQPTGNVRRVFYYGYHNDLRDQRFQSSLPIGRVLEDPPGEHPVILCYKLNNQFLAPENGAPVRVIVPDAYGNKSVKWLQKIVLTNEFKANDTYAEWNNDTESHVKTYARFIHVPEEVQAGQPVPITGLAQVGMSGLSQVQICLQHEQEPASEHDPYFTQAAWRDVQCLPPPEDWGGSLPDGKLPAVPRQIDPQTGKPLVWPLRDTLVHWATLVTDLSPGRYTLRCRTIDAQQVAQPLPRPFPKSGANQIQSVAFTVKG